MTAHRPCQYSISSWRKDILSNALDDQSFGFCRNRKLLRRDSELLNTLTGQNARQACGAEHESVKSAWIQPVDATVW